MGNHNYCVYIHRNLINNKVYIGITKYGDNPKIRWRNGKGYLQKKNGKYNQPKFANAINKYGWDNFEHIIWENNLSEEKAKHLENILIKLFDTENERIGYNELLGGEYGPIDEVSTYKRVEKFKKTIQDKQIKKSIEIFEERFKNGDENIFKCERCGRYFERKSKKDKKSMRRIKSNKYGSKRFCDYCKEIHKKDKRLVICVDCGKEFLVNIRNAKTCRCDDCKIEYRNLQRKKEEGHKDNLTSY